MNYLKIIYYTVLKQAPT